MQFTDAYDVSRENHASTVLSALIDLDRYVNNFFVLSKLSTDSIWRQIFVMRNDTHGTGIGTLADASYVKVRDPGAASVLASLYCFAYLAHNWMVHFTIEEYLSGLHDKILCP